MYIFCHGFNFLPTTAWAHSVLLESLSCAYGFDLVFVSLVISVLSMEIIRRGSRLCASSSTPGAAWGCNFKKQSVSVKMYSYFLTDPSSAGKKQMFFFPIYVMYVLVQTKVTHEHFAAAILALTYLKRSFFLMLKPILSTHFHTRSGR